MTVVEAFVLRRRARPGCLPTRRKKDSKAISGGSPDILSLIVLLCALACFTAGDRRKRA